MNLQQENCSDAGTEGLRIFLRPRTGLIQVDARK